MKRRLFGSQSSQTFLEALGGKKFKRVHTIGYFFGSIYKDSFPHTE